MDPVDYSDNGLALGNSVSGKQIIKDDSRS